MLENLTVAKFAITNHSAYGTAMDHALRTFADNRGGLTNTTIQGINDSKHKHLMENPSTFSLFFKNKYNFNERNPKTRSVLDIGRYHLERNFRKKVEKEKKKLKKKTDEFDENGNHIYKDEEGNIISTFNIGADGKQNNAEPENLDLRNLFNEDGEDNSEINYPVPQDSSDEEDEGEITGIQEYFDQNRWRFFVGGTEDVDAVTVFENCLSDLGLDVVGSNNRDLVLFLYSGEMAIIMKENKLKIHVDSGEILENDRETRENFYEFLRFQLDESKKTIQTILQYSGSFEGFKDYLRNMYIRRNSGNSIQELSFIPNFLSLVTIVLLTRCPLFT